MTDKLYTIGNFASMNKVSARMLRHYDKMGLLKPDTIGENGYRFYSASQISIAALIKKYRACHFSLEEIGVLLRDKEELPKLSEQKVQELYVQGATHMDALNQLHELSGADKTDHFDNLYEISITRRSSQFICVSSCCKESKIEQEFNKLYEFLDTADMKINGLSMLLCDISAENAYRMAVPVQGKQDENAYPYKLEVLKEGQYLSTFHYGDYFDIAEAYDRLLLYMEQNRMNSNGVFFERYFLDRSHTVFPAEYITEISIKITP